MCRVSPARTATSLPGSSPRRGRLGLKPPGPRAGAARELEPAAGWPSLSRQVNLLPRAPLHPPPPALTSSLLPPPRTPILSPVRQLQQALTSLPSPRLTRGTGTLSRQRWPRCRRANPQAAEESLTDPGKGKPIYLGYLNLARTEHIPVTHGRLRGLFCFFLFSSSLQT